MIDRQQPWWALHAANRAMRSVPAGLSGEIRKLLVELVEKKHCAPTIPARFSHKRGKTADATVVWEISDGPAVLSKLHDLDDAHLTLLLKTDRKHTYLHEFTAAVEGTTRDGLPWTAAIDLDDDLVTDQMGKGACGHATFHCHVGPSRKHPPEVRVPLPAVGPVAAVDWLLSVVIPTWEPAPWNELPPPPPLRR